MANVYQQGCFGDRIYGEEKAVLARPADLSLKEDHILAGNSSAIAEEVCLDETKFAFIEPADDCETRMLTLLPIEHNELLGLEEDDHLQYVHISENRVITASHQITGTLNITNNSNNALRVSGGIAVGSTFYDEDSFGGQKGQIITRTTTGVKWVTPSVENTLYVTKEGDDTNSGRSEIDAKATIGAALRAAKSGILGELQDASDQILANKKLIVDEAWGHLLTESSVVFPSELLISTKARLARNLIYENKTAIINAATAAVSGDLEYSNVDGKCARDIEFVVKAIAADIFSGGQDHTYKVASAYFGVDLAYLSDIFTPDTERLLAITAFNTVSAQINSFLVDPVGESGYYSYLRAEVTRLASLLTDALTNQTLEGFASEDERTQTKYYLYYDSANIVEDLWQVSLLAYPDIAGSESTYTAVIEKFIVGIAEDLYSLGTKGTVEFLDRYYTDYSGWRPEVILDALQEFENAPPIIVDSLGSRLSYLVGIVQASLSVPDPNLVPDLDPGYGRSPKAEVCKRDIGYFVDAVASDLRNGGNVNSVQVGESYYSGASLVFIDGEVPDTLVAFDKAREMMLFAMQNWRINNLGDVYTPVYSFEALYVDSLITNDPGSYPDCANAFAAINTYYDIVDFILDNGPNFERKEAYRVILEGISSATDFIWFQTLLLNPYIASEQSKCKRDITYILEAIAHDLRSNGNSMSREAAERYVTIPSVHAVTLDALQATRDFLTNLLSGSTLDILADVDELVGIIENRINGFALPVLNTGTWNVQQPSFKTTIFVRSGEYVENNPIVVPPNTSIFGDNLRSITVRPKNKTLDLFYVNNASYVTGITMSGNLYPGFAVSFPQKNGVGVAGIISRSPYIQNCTSLGTTGGGMRVDGNLAAGLKSMVLDAFTQYNQGGRGIEIINSGYAQLVSLFTICCDIGVKTSTGGGCDLTNSNSSFGEFGLVADGVGELEKIARVNYDVPAGETEITLSELGTQRPYNGQVAFFGSPYYLVKKIRIVDPGSGYDVPPVITISDPTGPLGVPARARAVIQEGELVEALLVREGRNFVTEPTIQVEAPPPGGTQAILALEMSPIYYDIESSTEVENGEAIITLTAPTFHPIVAGTSVSMFRQSKILASGHCFEYIGTGADINTALPIRNGVPNDDNEVEAVNGGSVIFTSTNQRGNFKIGDGVIIDQATGTIGGISFSRGLNAQITPLIIALQRN